jgi:hypothetical protein
MWVWMLDAEFRYSLSIHANVIEPRGRRSRNDTYTLAPAIAVAQRQAARDVGEGGPLEAMAAIGAASSCSPLAGETK